MQAVVDASALIAFARLRQLDLLPQLFDRVVAPDAVRREALARPDRTDAAALQDAFVRELVEVVDEPAGPAVPVDTLSGLGAGETAAIMVAAALGAAVVLDDRRARRAAHALRLRVIGSVGVLIEARGRGLIPSVELLVQELQAGGFHVGSRELEAARTADAE